jgi:hypothetical protein
MHIINQRSVHIKNERKLSVINHLSIYTKLRKAFQHL